jgi:hypothetical protein
MNFIKMGEFLSSEVGVEEPTSSMGTTASSENFATIIEITITIH